MRTMALVVFPLLAWLGGCAAERPLPLPGPPTKSGGEYYMGGAVAKPGVFAISESRPTIAQVILAAEPLEEFDARTNVDVIRRINRNREEWHQFHWYQLKGDTNWTVHADDQIMVGVNTRAGSCFGPGTPNPFDHRVRAIKR